VQHIQTCTLLKHLRINKEESFCKIRNLPPQKARIGKAKAHAEIMLRGFSQEHLGRRSITKILTSISHILTYALKAFPLNTTDYDLIDKVFAEIIPKPTRHHSNHTTCNFYEQHITPPSELIRRNTISLHINVYIKAKNSKRSIPNNFLSKEVNTIESTWGFDSNQVIQQYKGKQIIPNQIISSLLEARIDNHLEIILSGTYTKKNSTHSAFTTHP
jgi:hypothetical protein